LDTHLSAKLSFVDAGPLEVSAVEAELRGQVHYKAGAL
jgi:hypothetical protein